MVSKNQPKTKWYVRVIKYLGEKCIQTIRNNVYVLRHIIKNVSKRLVSIIPSWPLSRKWKKIVFQNCFFRGEGQLEMDGNDGTREESEDSTMIVQMEEVMCVVRVMPFVTKLSSLGAHNRHGPGCQVSLSCFRYRKFNRCGKKQQPPVQVSSRYPTPYVCFQELRKQLEENHGGCSEVFIKQAVTESRPKLAQKPQTTLPWRQKRKGYC